MDNSSKIPQYNTNNIYQNDPHFMFYPTVRDFVKFTGKHLRQSLFFNKVAGLRPGAVVFLRIFQNFSEHLFLEHLWWLLLFLLNFVIAFPEK